MRLTMINIYNYAWGARKKKYENCSTTIPHVVVKHHVSKVGRTQRSHFEATVSKSCDTWSTKGLSEIDCKHISFLVGKQSRETENSQLVVIALLCINYLLWQLFNHLIIIVKKSKLQNHQKPITLPDFCRPVNTLNNQIIERWNKRTYVTWSLFFSYPKIRADAALWK